jgi:hypothetical protein
MRMNSMKTDNLMQLVLFKKTEKTTILWLTYESTIYPISLRQ